VATLSEDALHRLEGHRQIEQLAYRYAIAVDSRDLASLGDLFVADVGAGIDSRERDKSHQEGAARGRGPLVDWYRRSLTRFGMSIHSVTNHRIEFVDDARATGIVYCRVEMEVGDEWIVQAIQYQDRYVSEAGSWYFEFRKHLTWYSLDARSVPLGDAPVTFPPEYRGRGALPSSLPTWQQFWEAASGPPS
jgi:hypothetical protein